MPEVTGSPEELRAPLVAERDALASAQRALKNFRYIVSSVNSDAERTWAELWDQLRGGLHDSDLDWTGSAGVSELEGDRARFSENFWLLKHYLDYIQRLCRETARP